MSALCKRIVCLMLSIIFIAFGLSVGSLVCNHPSEEIENTVSSFYREPTDSLDAVMIGSSAINKDVQPSVIWNKNNITSYCLSVGACSANIYASMLEEVISKQPNALIVVDIDGFLVDDKYQEEEAPIILWRDSMPKNQNHRELIKKYFSDSLPESFFPFIRYHRNMTSLYAYLTITYRLEKKKLLGIRDSLGGATTNTVSPYKKVTEFVSDSAVSEQLSPYSQRVFEEFILYCRQKSLKKVLFINLPKCNGDIYQIERNKTYNARANYIKNEIQKYGYDYFDYNATGNAAGLKLDEHYADTLHLTTNGAVIFSEYFSDYLKENYSFKEKNSEICKDWNNRYIQAEKILNG